jgi:FtsP/CotA-like multicopper oxidase with cupredoxin domain
MKNLYIALGLAIVLILGGWYFAQNVSSVPIAEGSQMVELKDGDTYDLTASYVTKLIDGKEQTMLAYNGSIPGPTIKVAQGAEITINFKNDMDIPSLLHSHGVRMDNAFDGSQLQQEEMQPGESFSYKLKFPDAGVYWYHPHAKEVYGQGLGLYGAFIVAPSDPNYFPPVNREVPVFLSDIPIENGGVALDKNTASHSLMGHYGNVMLINGEDAYNLDAKAGEVLRLYVINAANARPFNFAIKGLKLKLVGADSGAYERASFVDSVVLGPSERAIVDVLIPAAGVYEIQNKTPDRIYTLGTISANSEGVDASYSQEFNILQVNQATVQSINPFRALLDSEPSKRLALTLTMGGNMMQMQGMGHGGHMMQDGTMMGGSMMSGSPDGIEWDDTNQMMNQMSNTDSIKWKLVDQDTGKENMDIDWVFKKEEPVKIRIFNDPKSMHPMQHPIHFHGQRFLVVARDGVPQTNLVWKDTTLVKAGETVDIILDPSNPGEWMAHCHISEHLEAGMMLKFEVK